MTRSQCSSGSCELPSLANRHRPTSLSGCPNGYQDHHHDAAKFGAWENNNKAIEHAVIAKN